MAGKSSTPAVELEIGDRTVRISNPDRVYFSARGETKLNLVSQSGAVAHCSINPNDSGASDSIDIRLGSDFDTSNYLVLPHSYAGGSAAPTLECSSDAIGTFTVKSAKLVAIESQTLATTP